MSGENVKKTRRGKRGGKQKKAKEEIVQDRKRRKVEEEDNVVQDPSNKPAPVTDTAASFPAVNFTSTTAPTSDQPNDFWLVKPDLRHYLTSIERTIQQEFAENSEADDEDRQLLLNNAFKEMKDSEKEIAADAECSRILEAILDVSNDELIEATFVALQPNFMDLARHRIASHVLQKLITLLGKMGSRQDEPRPDVLLNFCKTFSADSYGLVADIYGTHVLRTLLAVLSGSIQELAEADHRKQRYPDRRHDDEANSSSRDRSQARAGAIPQPSTGRSLVPKEFTEAFQTLCITMIEKFETIDLQKLVFDRVANPTLQLCLVNEHTSLPFLEKLFNISDWSTTIAGSQNAFLMELLKHPIGSRLVERLIMNADGKVLRKLYMTYLAGHLVDLCQDPISNFVVQKYIARLTTAKQLSKIVKELCERFTSLFNSNRIGVCASIISASARIGAHHKEIFDALVTAVSADPTTVPQEFLKKILYLSTTQHHDRRHPRGHHGELGPRMHIQGAMIVEGLIQFPYEYSQYVVSGFAGMSNDESVSWAFDATGSRILERLFRAEHLPADARASIFNVFKDKFTQMATDRCASHVIDTLFQLGDMELKQRMASNLLMNYTPVSTSLYGRLVLRNLRIEEFRRDKEAWKSRLRNFEKRKAHMNSFVDEMNSDAAKAPSAPTIRDKPPSTLKAAAAIPAVSSTAAPIMDDVMMSILDAVVATKSGGSKKRKKGNTDK
ncbi:hypothetical protein SmJEL517_g04285 [Synchytrium microbalum]|uniref:Nucleolar protein 9 n=1 Tax=Synchytrium microbalum TaxID=1806994 RepID=A0A507C538_9FUNG|nr:uncharacterized protein SmJEL517_g04285 [Synchytrium microbalum]TPX32653.1 hypothetical protein SmJEL517_g04285 [Synchytrium microbalum]